MATRILLVEDDAAIREMLQVPFQKAGYEVREAGDVRSANPSCWKTRRI